MRDMAQNGQDTHRVREAVRNAHAASYIDKQCVGDASNPTCSAHIASLLAQELAAPEEVHVQAQTSLSSASSSATELVRTYGNGALENYFRDRGQDRRISMEMVAGYWGYWATSSWAWATAKLGHRDRAFQ